MVLCAGMLACTAAGNCSKTGCESAMLTAGSGGNRPARTSHMDCFLLGCGVCVCVNQRLFITNTGPPRGVYTCPHKVGYGVTLPLLVVYIYLPYHLHRLYSLPPPLQSILLTCCRCRHDLLLGLCQYQCEHQVLHCTNFGQS